MNVLRCLGSQDRGESYTMLCAVPWICDHCILLTQFGRSRELGNRHIVNRGI